MIDRERIYRAKVKVRSSSIDYEWDLLFVALVADVAFVSTMCEGSDTRSV